MAKKRTPYDKPKKPVKKHKIPPCPDPELYCLVRKKDGSYFWRRRRGTVTPAVLNPVLAAMAKYAKRSMAAAAQLVTALDPFTCNRYSDLEFATYKHNDQRFAALFTKSIIAEGKMGWSFFDGYDLNPNCSMEQIMKSDYTVSLTKNTAAVKLPLSDNMVDKRRSNAVTHFYFELILISGDPAKAKSLRSENDISEDYPYKSYHYFNKEPGKYCELSVIIPEKKPYILILKAATRDGKYRSGYNHEGLKVIGWG